MDNESLACSSVEKDLTRVVSKLEQLHENAEADIGDIATQMSELVEVLSRAEQLVTTLNSSTQVSQDDPMGDAVSMQVETEPTAPQRLTERQVESVRNASRQVPRARAKTVHGAP